MITFEFETTTPQNFDNQRISFWLKTIAASHGKKAGAINYLFCSDEKILEINRKFLQHDYYTDIITFDCSDKQTLNGDIYISLDTVMSNAEKFEQTPETELLRVIVHGLLHLAGQDDKTFEDENEMRRKEDEALKLFF